MPHTAPRMPGFERKPRWNLLGWVESSSWWMNWTQKRKNRHDFLPVELGSRPPPRPHGPHAQSGGERGGGGVQWRPPEVSSDPDHRWYAQRLNSH